MPDNIVIKESNWLSIGLDSDNSIIPKSKLFSDEYSVDDLDKITEEQLKSAVYVSCINSYLLKDNKNLAIDYFTGQYIYKLYEHVYSIYTGVEEKGDRLLFINKEYIFVDNLYKTLVIKTTKGGKIRTCPKIYGFNLFKKYYKEDLSKNIFVPILSNIENFIIDDKIKGIKYDSPYNDKIIPNTYSKTLGKKYTFGVELESCSGNMPYFLTSQFPFSSVHDGSLRHEDDDQVYGLEYVTDVLRGDYGLKTLKFLCIELSKRCLLNYKCSIHLHLGNFNFTKENIVYLYTMLSKVQNELFNWFPAERRSNQYCRKLPNLISIDIPFNDPNKNYNFNRKYLNLFENISRSDIGVKANRNTDHPYGHKCRYDHATMRYCWANFVPTIFNTRGNNIYTIGNNIYTIEFRIHEGNYNYYAIKNWLLVCMSFLSAIDNNKVELHEKLFNNTLNMETILSWAYSPTIVTKLMDFYSIREHNPDFNRKVLDSYEIMDPKDQSLKIIDL